MGVRLGPGWQSPAAMPRRWLAGLFAVSAIFASLVAIFSSDQVHQLWGAMAACGYGLAVAAVLGWRKRGADLALGLSFCGALVLPLGWMAAKALEQPEVVVVARSAWTLIHQGSPYAGAAIAGAMAAALGGAGVTVTYTSPSPSYSTYSSTPTGRFYLSTPHNTRLSCHISGGILSASPNKQPWEVWTISDNGNGKVCLTSHTGQQLACQPSGVLYMSPNRAAWEQFTLRPSGTGKYYIVAHTGNHLAMSDRGEFFCRNANTGAWEQWELLPA